MNEFADFALPPPAVPSRSTLPSIPVVRRLVPSSSASKPSPPVITPPVTAPSPSSPSPAQQPPPLQQAPQHPPLELRPVRALPAKRTGFLQKAQASPPSKAPSQQLAPSQPPKSPPPQSNTNAPSAPSSPTKRSTSDHGLFFGDDDDDDNGDSSSDEAGSRDVPLPRPSAEVPDALKRMYQPGMPAPLLHNNGNNSNHNHNHSGGHGGGKHGRRRSRSRSNSRERQRNNNDDDDGDSSRRDRRKSSDDHRRHHDDRRPRSRSRERHRDRASPQKSTAKPSNPEFIREFTKRPSSEGSRKHAESDTLFVWELPDNVKAYELQQFFSQWAPVADSRVFRSKATGNPIGFVQFRNIPDGVKAYKGCFHKQFNGVDIRVDYAQAPNKEKRGWEYKAKAYQELRARVENSALRLFNVLEELPEVMVGKEYLALSAIDRRWHTALILENCTASVDPTERRLLPFLGKLDLDVVAMHIPTYRVRFSDDSHEEYLTPLQLRSSAEDIMEAAKQSRSKDGASASTSSSANTSPQRALEQQPKSVELGSLCRVFVENDWHDGIVEDVSRKSHLALVKWGSNAMWLDYDDKAVYKPREHGEAPKITQPEHDYERDWEDFIAFEASSIHQQQQELQPRLEPQPSDDTPAMIDLWTPPRVEQLIDAPPYQPDVMPLAPVMSTPLSSVVQASPKVASLLQRLKSVDLSQVAEYTPE